MKDFTTQFLTFKPRGRSSQEICFEYIWTYRHCMGYMIKHIAEKLGVIHNTKSLITRVHSAEVVLTLWLTCWPTTSQYASSISSQTYLNFWTNPSEKGMDSVITPIMSWKESVLSFYKDCLCYITAWEINEEAWHFLLQKYTCLFITRKGQNCRKCVCAWETEKERRRIRTQTGWRLLYTYLLPWQEVLGRVLLWSQLAFAPSELSLAALRTLWLPDWQTDWPPDLGTRVYIIS